MTRSLVVLIIMAVLMTSCQMSPVLTMDELTFPVALKLKSRKGRVDVTDYHTESAVKTFEGTISRNKIETMNFTTEWRTLEFRRNEQITQTVVVTRKDGDMELHDMAFPEVNEELEATYSVEGKVLEVKRFPSNGIFYVPRISLPEKPVSVGDTWTMQADWVSRKNAIQMRLDMVTVFKRVVPCGKDVCADLEVSGEVLLPSLKSKTVELQSSLNGRILFAIGEGVEVWSEIRNSESMTIDGVRIDVDSCLESTIRSPSHLVFKRKLKLDCQVPFNEPVQMPI